MSTPRNDYIKNHYTYKNDYKNDDPQKLSGMKLER